MLGFSSVDISVKEAGRRGGLANLQKFGREYFVRIGRVGGLRTKALYDGYFKEWGKLGGRPRKPTLHECRGRKKGGRLKSQTSQYEGEKRKE
jgi:hypothetical protein